MIEKIYDKYRYSYILLREMVKTDFKLRYQGSILGYLWSLVKPLALFTILYIVFVKFLKLGNSVPHYAIYLLLGIVLWSFFVEVTANGLGSIVGRGDLLRKLNFPRYVIVLSTAFSALINLGINLVVVFLFMVITKTSFSWTIILLPFLIIELFIISISLAFLLSSLYVKYRDIQHIWDVALQALFYAVPIIYPLNIIPVVYSKILLLNPLAQILQDARYVTITDQTITLTQLTNYKIVIIIPFVIVIFLAIISARYFKNRSKYFAEEI